MPPALLRHPQQQLAYAKSKHGYAAQNLDELDFPKGALLQIINQRDNDWWEGIYNQKQGWLPSSYVKLLKVRSKSVDNKLGGVPNSKAELLEKRKSKDDTSFGVKPKNDSFGSPNTRSSRSPSTWNPNAKYSLNGSALSGIQNGSQNGANNGTPTPTSSLNSSPTQTSRYIYSSVQTQKKYATIAEKYSALTKICVRQPQLHRDAHPYAQLGHLFTSRQKMTKFRRRLQIFECTVRQQKEPYTEPVRHSPRTSGI